MIVIVMWLFVLKQAAGVGKAIAEMVKAWIAAISEIPKRHLWGMNTTHVVTDGRVPVRIESVRERSEHFHYGSSQHRDEEEEESGDPEPVPRSSQILEHLMIGNRRNGSSNGHTP